MYSIDAAKDDWKKAVLMAATTIGRRDNARIISDLKQRELTHKDSICACGKTPLCPIIRLPT